MARRREANMFRRYLRRQSVGFLSFLWLVGFGSTGHSQSFNSGSNGSDGPLNLTTPGTIIFDPSALGLHPTIPNVFNFTTINIAAGVKVKLTNKILTAPVYWLAQRSEEHTSELQSH